MGNVRAERMKEGITEDYERIGRDDVRVRRGREREGDSQTGVGWDGIRWKKDGWGKVSASVRVRNV